MADEPRVSVITPFFNGARFIREAIESVLSQTYENWELLLVDDGSTDGSSELARQYAEAHRTRIRYLEHADHRNRGATVSRNLGVRNSRGAYLAFLDADDVWLPQKLQRQVEILESCPEAVMVFGTPHYWRSWQTGAESTDSVPKLWVEPNTPIRPPRMLAASYPLGPGGAPCPSDLLVRRECVERIGGFEEAFVGMYQLFEDQAFLAKVYLAGAVIVADEGWTKYRLHEDSCVAVVTRNGKYHRVRRYYLRWLRRYLSSTGVRDTAIHHALREALRKCDPTLLQWTYRQCRRLRHHLGRTRLIGAAP